MTHNMTARRSAAMVAAIAVVLLGALGASPAAADTAPINPADPATPTTVSADGLPTVQIDGVVWSQVVVGNTVYVAGSFQTARPAGAAPGVNTVARHNLLAFDIVTGNLISSFAPDLDGQALAIAASPDGKRIYVTGDFSKVNGQWHVRAAAFDTATGALVTSFHPTLSSRGRAIVATNDTVYIGGSFTSAASVTGGTLVPRAHLAAFSAATGALTAFVADTDAAVNALAVTVDGAKVVVGGNFTTLGGVATYGLGAVSPATGASIPVPANQYIRDAGANASITSLYADASGIYGGGYVYGAGGNTEGAFRADVTTGALVWVEDCHGDTYSVFPQGDAVYVASHEHYCGNIGGFPQTSPWTFQHATAFSKAVTGVNTHDIYGYPDHVGQPAPTLLTWFPELTMGTYTGQNQAAWSVTGNATYVVYGGEFPTVNGAAQQGLVRFESPAIAPNAQGPRITGANFNPSVISIMPGQVRVRFTTNWDRDNQTLTYRLFRGSENSTPIYTEDITTPFWKVLSRSVVDANLPPGSTQQYLLSATDHWGNVVKSQWVTITVNSTSLSAYPLAVLGDSAGSYWRLGEPSGTNVADSAGSFDMTAGSGVTRGTAGAIVGDADTASTFNGSGTGFAATSTAQPAPDTFTAEAWVKTTSSSGGKIIGFGDASTGNSSNYDRQVYLDNAGHIWFGVFPGSAQTLSSTATFNDGKWHHVVASLGSNGMRLYVDARLVGQRTDVTGGQAYSGYWRIGGDNLSGWTNQPSSSYLNGAIDEVAVYPTVLSAQTVATHYALGSAAQPPNQAPTAAFTATAAGSAVSVDGSTSHDPDGTVTGYAWQFGDGATGTGATASHTYASSGTFTVRLTVTDNAGATGTTTHDVAVTVPSGTALASDTFTRTVAAGWGTSEVGGPWSTTGSAANYSVAAGVGTQHMTVAGSTVATSLGLLSSSTDLTATMSLDRSASGGGTYVSFQGRKVGTLGDYRCKLHFYSTGAVTLATSSTVGTTETALQVATVSGLTYAGGDQLRVRVQVTGTSPTTVRAKVWRVGSAEPAAWLVSSTDSTAALQATGGIGLISYLSGTSAAPVVASFDDLAAASVQ